MESRSRRKFTALQLQEGSTGETQPSRRTSTRRGSDLSHRSHPSTGSVKHTISDQEGPDAGLDARSVICHPSLIPELLMRSVAGAQWVTLRKGIYLFPMQFRDMEEEDEFSASENDVFRVRLPVAAGLMLFASLLVWVLYGLGCTYGWISLHYELITNAFHPLCALLTLLILYLLAAPWLTSSQHHLEVIFYLVSIFYMSVLYFWCFWALWYAGEVTPMTGEYAINYKYWLELRLLADGLVNGVMALFLVQCDIYLPTLTRRSIYWHVMAWLLYTATRVMQVVAFPPGGLLAMNTIDILQTLLIHATAFLFRWFRELQDRSVILKVQESQARVQAVRSAQASRRRRQGVSAAEELIDMIDTVRQNVLTKRTALREKGPTPLLDDTEETLMGCIKKLARGAQDETSINREGGSTEARTAEEAATEDMFLEMYRKPGAARKNEEMRSNRRKQSNVRFGTSVVYGIGGDSQEQQIYDGEGNAIGSMPTRARSVKFTIDGVAMPRLSLTDTFETTVGFDFHFPLLDLSKKSEWILMEVGYTLLSTQKSYMELEDEEGEQILLAFLYALEKFYWSRNPYHSSAHGATVAHMAVSLLRLLDIWDLCLDLERVAVIVGALGHDVAHPGRTNNFYINACGILAMLQNDLAVLEAAHSFILQGIILSSPETNILAKLSAGEIKDFRKNLIALILATDMSKHFEMLSKARVRRMSPDFDLTHNELDRQLAAALCFKGADMGHACLEWRQHLEWSVRIREEYYQQVCARVCPASCLRQGDEERSLDLPISPLCDREELANFSKTQCGFLNFVVIPLMDEISELNHSQLVGMEVMSKLLLNQSKWESMAQAGRTESAPAALSNKRIAPRGWLEFHMLRTLKATHFSELVAEPSAAVLART